MPARFVYGGRNVSDSGPVRVKLCGLRAAEDVAVAAKVGASYVGFVFFPPSPRSVTIAEGRALALEAPIGLAKVALVVNPDDALLDDILAQVPVDILQLHGAESPDRVAEIRARFGLPVMKAVGVSYEADLQALEDHAQVADMLLVDAKAPKGSVLPGGNGLSFDWRLIAGRKWALPWMLAGGLTADNVAEAVRLTGARQVDVSSGVEAAPGVKDPVRMAAFTEQARMA